MKLILKQRECSFKTESGNEYSLREIKPSRPYGAWIGNTITIRQWRFLKKGDMIYKECSDEQIAECEKSLGELDNFDIFTHPALGRVSSPITE